MAGRERLELTLTKRNGGREWDRDKLVVKEDPKDHDVLMEHMKAMAMRLDGRSHGGWLLEYEIRVHHLDGNDHRDFTTTGMD